MKKNRKKQTVIFLLCVIGLVGAYALARGLSGMLYSSGIPAAGGNVLNEDASLPAAKKALTEEEIIELMTGTKWKKIVVADTGTQAADGEPETEEEPEAEPVIDFASLWEINDDVYAWITVPGTMIDYPILQHPTDNSKYLNYNIDGSKGYPGCIYTENMNARDFSDNNTVLYGHNMKNGSMFAGLHQFEDKDFFEEHNKIIIYLPEETLYYEIFAAYTYDDRHLMYSFNFSSQKVYAAYLKSIFDIRDMNANIDREVEVTDQDKIITLSTCISNQKEKRLLVQAVLMEEGNSKENCLRTE